MEKEREIRSMSGWFMLPASLLIGVMPLLALIRSAQMRTESPGIIFFGILGLGVGVLMLAGHYTLQPNEAAVLTLFGSYKGADKKSGFKWVNPFYTKQKVSLRARNLDGDKLKVNDKAGNPIEIGAVIVWRVSDTYRAMFEVDDYEKYVRLQSDSAVRHLANDYAYDHGADGEDHTGEITLRSNIDRVSEALQKELEARLIKAGIVVDEARLTHLAYAPEIAQAMLKRQQAEAVIAARTKIVHGAVSMVEMALTELEKKEIVELDTERKAAMVSNLLVILCGESDAQPVLNTGTLYT